MRTTLGLIVLLTTGTLMAAENISAYLTSISITVRAEADYRKSEGSGTLFKRKVGKRDVVFCHTAAHVIAHMRSVREEIVDGKPRKVVEFGEPLLVRKLRNPDTGRIVGETAVIQTPRQGMTWRYYRYWRRTSRHPSLSGSMTPTPP